MGNFGSGGLKDRMNHLIASLLQFYPQISEGPRTAKQWHFLCQNLIDCHFGLSHLNKHNSDKQYSRIAYILCVHMNPNIALFPQLFNTGSWPANNEFHSLGNLISILFSSTKVSCSSLLSPILQYKTWVNVALRISNLGLFSE